MYQKLPALSGPVEMLDARHHADPSRLVLRPFHLPGCALLDRDDPSTPIGRTREPGMAAVGAERSGYVPRVSYSCGALKVRSGC